VALTALAVSGAAFISAFLGGILALRAVRYVGIIIALGAGIRIGAAFFDLIPEAVDLVGGDLDQVMVATAIGFLAFYVIEKLTTVHVGHEAAAELDHGQEAHRHVGVIGATGMSIHSFLDGVALATGLAVGGGLGLVIAIVVVVHRLSDGISVVSLLAASHVPREIAMRWVAVVAIAPVIGVAIGLVIIVPDQVLGILLALFAGFFLYVGAAELLPEAHRSDRSRWVVVATLSGVLGIYVVSRFAGTLG
jgi:ZIP family zinc transporter